MRSILAVLLLGLSTALAAQTAEPSFAEQSAALESAIERAGKIDPKHPEFLAAHLEYAMLLARNTSSDDCAARLPAADAHFKVVTDSLVTPVVLKTARGRVPMVGYYLEMARSRCSADASKAAALQAALKYARDSVAGYRALFMYEPMTVMQYNVAQTLHGTGDDVQAAKELQATLDLDREFGFKADAEENFRTFSQWQGKQISDADVTAFGATSTPASITLQFGWAPTKVDVASTFDNATYEGGAVRHTKFSLPMSGTISAANDELVYEVKAGEPKLDAATAGADVERKVVALMARILGKIPTVVISKTGEFKEVRDLDAFSKQMTTEIDAAVKNAVPENDPRYPGVKAAADRELKPLASTENLLGKMQQDYQLGTGIWIGATLEQGGWVSLPLTLSMNGTQGFIEHTVEVQFSRRVPCGAGKPSGGCVELLLEAVPTAKALADVVQKTQESGKGRFDYVAATRIRLVVDPLTLLPYESETLRYTYLALANKGQRAVKIASEQMASVYRYRK